MIPSGYSRGNNLERLPPPRNDEDYTTSSMGYGQTTYTTTNDFDVSQSIEMVSPIVGIYNEGEGTYVVQGNSSDLDMSNNNNYHGNIDEEF